MAPTPALWALLRWTCSPVANRIPSLIAIERCENDAMRSSFQPAVETGRGIEEKSMKGRKKQNPSTKVHSASKQNETNNKEGIPMNQLSCATKKTCSFLMHRHQVITKTFESCFLKRQACKKGWTAPAITIKTTGLMCQSKGLTQGAQKTQDAAFWVTGLL